MENRTLPPYENYERTPQDFCDYQPGYERGSATAPGNAYGYRGPEEFRPLTPWAYLAYGLLFSVPLIGLVALMYYSLNDSNINRRSFARSYWCMMLVLAALAFLVLPLNLPFVSSGLLPFL